MPTPAARANTVPNPHQRRTTDPFADGELVPSSAGAGDPDAEHLSAAGRLASGVQAANFRTERRRNFTSALSTFWRRGCDSARKCILDLEVAPGSRRP